MTNKALLSNYSSMIMIMIQIKKIKANVSKDSY